MQNLEPKSKPGQTADDCAVAIVSLELAIKQLKAIAAAPIIAEAHLENLRLHMGRGNARCANLANTFGNKL